MHISELFIVLMVRHVLATTGLGELLFIVRMCEAKTSCNRLETDLGVRGHGSNVCDISGILDARVAPDNHELSSRQADGLHAPLGHD